MPQHEAINYVELPARDPQASRQFFSELFGWQFTDYGPDYVAFSGAGLDGGFFRSEGRARSAEGSALVVLYSENLEASLAKISATGAEILQPIFSFPGGRRFHFLEPSGNELAVWSDR